MPFRVEKTDKGYRLYNLEKKTYAKRTFKTRQAAVNMKNTYMKYDKTKKKKAVPKGSHRMPDGSIMKDSDMKKKYTY
jgi:hypothetical protein